MMLKSHHIGMLVLVPLITMLGGCSSDNSGIRGRVISGQMTFIGEVDREDPRLKFAAGKDQPPAVATGVEGVRVVARSTGGQSNGTVVGNAISDKDGNFVMSLSDQKASIYPIDFTATSPGHGEAKQVMPAPAGDRRLLIILKPSSAGGGR